MLSRLYAMLIFHQFKSLKFSVKHLKWTHFPKTTLGISPFIYNELMTKQLVIKYFTQFACRYTFQLFFLIVVDPCIKNPPHLDKTQWGFLHTPIEEMDTTSYPLVFGSDNDFFVLLRHHDTGAKGSLQHIDDQVVWQNVQFFHVIPCHVHLPCHALSARLDST